MHRVLVVDDSETACLAQRRTIEQDTDLYAEQRQLRDVARSERHSARSALIAARPEPEVARVCPTVATCPRLVVVGASTGGPVRVRELLAALPQTIPVPIAVAQHIAQGFGRGFADWLMGVTGKRTLYVDRRMQLEPGSVYVAPDDADLVIDVKIDTWLCGTPQASNSPLVTPNVDVLFRSAAASLRSAVVSVLMTGMGTDGVAGTLELGRVGATTLVQDPKTCAVPTMPDSAIRTGIVSAVLAPTAIPAAIERLLRANHASLMRHSIGPV